MVAFVDAETHQKNTWSMVVARDRQLADGTGGNISPRPVGAENRRIQQPLKTFRNLGALQGFAYRLQRR